MTPLDLNALALECAGDWVPEALKKRHRPGLRGQRGAGHRCSGDAARLRELLDNLLDNAVRYSREGGRVTVRVSAEPQPTVAVSDDGPGIPPEERERDLRALPPPARHAAPTAAAWGSRSRRRSRTSTAARSRCDEDADGVGNTLQSASPAVRSHGGADRACKRPFIL